VPLPRPEPGLVIAYDYLWRHEHEAGRDYGSKIRPCAIVVAVENNSGATEVVVAPITHLEPMPPSQGIEIPPKVKQHLGLDHDRSWVIVNDLNVFTWPGFDLHPVPNAGAGIYHYGFLPPKLHRAIAERITALGNAAHVTNRNERA
jgi:hypothetical protein